MFQYLRNILPLIDSLSCDLQDKVNIMGYGAAGVCDVIQNGRKDSRNLGFSYKFKFIGKTRKIHSNIFLLSC